MTETPRRRSRYNELRAAKQTEPESMTDVRHHNREDTMTIEEATPTRTPANRSRQAQQAIQDAIKDLILSEGLASGDPMPTESELVDRIGVSRNSVREALKALQAVDIVEIRHGFGTYVGTCSLGPFADALIFRGRKSLRGDRHDLYEIIDLRQALEAGLVGQLISVIDDDDLVALRVKLDELRAVAGQGAAGDDADRAFHEQLFAPLDSQLMGQLLRVFWDVYHDLSSELPPKGLDPEGICAIHEAIYDAVAARDSTRAAQAIHEHFGGIRARVRS